MQLLCHIVKSHTPKFDCRHIVQPYGCTWEWLSMYRTISSKIFHTDQTAIVVTYVQLHLSNLSSPGTSSWSPTLVGRPPELRIPVKEKGRKGIKECNISINPYIPHPIAISWGNLWADLPHVETLPPWGGDNNSSWRHLYWAKFWSQQKTMATDEFKWKCNLLQWLMILSLRTLYVSYLGWTRCFWRKMLSIWWVFSTFSAESELTNICFPSASWMTKCSMQWSCQESRMQSTTQASISLIIKVYDCEVTGSRSNGG